MALFDGFEVDAVGPALRREGLDGWLLYDFRGINPVAQRLIGLGGMGTRRIFVFIPAAGRPTAVAHKIELQGLENFPGDVLPYASWEDLHRFLGGVVSGKRVAMEISPEDQVPYLDWVPSGVVQLVAKLGGTVVPSARLVSEFAAGWSSAELAGHRESAEIIAGMARETLASVVTQVGTAREAAVQKSILDALDAAGLHTNHPPIVAFGANAANPHYEPLEGSDALLEADQVILLDLWAGKAKRSVYADQTWMAFSGGAPSARVVDVWTAVRDARDAVVDRLQTASANGNTVTGADLDDAARGLLTERGYGAAFIHRTGHSIDLDLHGSGPHLDNFETHDSREIVPGVGFSVEPGVYLTGDFGVRSEINGVLLESGPEFTPREPQTDLILPA